jgi:N-acetylglucosamine-6-phosphate deacetylase
VTTPEARFVTGSFDIHVNGYAGADFCSRDLTLDQCRRACDELAADGTDGILATVITDSIDGICGKLARLVAFRERDPAIARMIAGFHVEGPFLSRKPGCPGAHDPTKIVPANPDDAKRLIDATDGLLRLVTLAPECDAGLATTRYLAGQGVTESAGHCDPSLDELGAAIDSGLSMVTHLGNGCASGVAPTFLGSLPFWSRFACPVIRRQNARAAPRSPSTAAPRPPRLRAM